MAYVDIPAHIDGATVVVFEPSQHPRQGEVVLDSFELMPGESVQGYELRSATAGIRYLPLGAETLRRLRIERDGEEPVSTGAEGQPHPYGQPDPIVQEEMDVGRGRQEEVEAMENKRYEDEQVRKEKETGRAAQKDAARDARVREAKRGSDEPHAGSPDVEGQTPLSPAAHVTRDPSVEKTAGMYPQAGTISPTPASRQANERASDNKSTKTQRATKSKSRSKK